MDGLLSGPGASGLRADDADGAAGPRRGLSVYLLGPLRIFRDGHPVEGGWRRKSLELLAYLAAHPRGAARDQVLEALWPGADPKVSQSNLWHSASHLRCRLRRPGDNARIVQKIDDRYRMDFAHVWVDVVAFEEAIRRSRDSGNRGALLEVACSLYRGEYCEGWYYGWAGLRWSSNAIKVCSCKRPRTGRFSYRRRTRSTKLYSFSTEPWQPTPTTRSSTGRPWSWRTEGAEPTSSRAATACSAAL